MYLLPLSYAYTNHATSSVSRSNLGNLEAVVAILRLSAFPRNRVPPQHLCPEGDRALLIQRTEQYKGG